MPTRLKTAWRGTILAVPALGACEGARNHDLLGGAIVGSIIAAVLYGITRLIVCALKKVRRQSNA